MGVWFLGILFVFILPLVEGALLALWLGDMHKRHPLPLGGVIASARKPVVLEDEPDEESDEEPDEDAADDEASEEESADVPTPEQPVVAETPPTSAAASVFDGTENIPKDLPVNNVLDAMTADAGAPAVVPNDLEHRIEESARATPENLPKATTEIDDLNHEDLQALMEALPGTKIDFSQDLEKSSEPAEAISPMAKELLGENFDFDALEEQAKQTAVSRRQMAAEEQPTAEDVLDIQEDAAGIVQVSSPFMFDAASQFADFAMPQAVVPMFSDDWIQEMNSASELIKEDTEKFCFTEESRPMFVKKRDGSRG